MLSAARDSSIVIVVSHTRTAYSLADNADLRRQKTGWKNGTSTITAVHAGINKKKDVNYTKKYIELAP